MKHFHKLFRLKSLLSWALLFSLGCARCSSTGPAGPVGIVFTPVGESFNATDLIDLEFLPGQGGEALVIGKGGTLYYVTVALTPLSQTATISVADSGEQGLLNVAADPEYAINRLIYLYFTSPDGSQNQVDRFTVDVNVNAGSFSLSDRQTIITFPKSDSPSPGSNHNGGGLLFDADKNLIIGVGDGGGSASADQGAEIGQDPSTRLGKILRIIPNRSAGSGGFSIPEEGNSGPVDSLPEIYALGVRNPFTLAARDTAIFIGDVGSSVFEEINLINGAGLNFGWPLAEGNSDDPNFRNPLHGYAHGDVAFINDDPETSADASTSKSLMVGTFYDGSQYGGALAGHLIYAEFFAGWVRGLRLNGANEVVSDSHLGHLAGMTSLQQAPDGFLYAVSLFGSDHILRLDLDD